MTYTLLCPKIKILQPKAQEVYKLLVSINLNKDLAHDACAYLDLSYLVGCFYKAQIMSRANTGIKPAGYITSYLLPEFKLVLNIK